METNSGIASPFLSAGNNSPGAHLIQIAQESISASASDEVFPQVQWHPVLTQELEQQSTNLIVRI